MSKNKPKNEVKDDEVKVKLLPVRLDPELYADKGRELVGHINSANMLRLQQTVLRMPSMAIVELLLSRGPYGYPMLSGKIQHSLDLRCERCLDDLNLCI